MFRIIQCRTTEAEVEECNQIDSTNRRKEALGLQKMHFRSHIEMMFKHEFYVDWEDYDIDTDNFVLLGWNSDDKIVYKYRVIIEEFHDEF